MADQPSAPARLAGSIGLLPTGSSLLARSGQLDWRARLAFRAGSRRGGTIFEQFRGELWSIFVVFRGRFAQASRFPARRAEPLFVLAGAVLQRVRTFCEMPENRQKSKKNRSAGALRTSRMQRTRFFRSQRRLGMDFDRLGVLPGAPGCHFWRLGAYLAAPGGLRGRAQGDPGTLRDAPRTSLRRPGWLEGVPRSI